MTYDGIIDNNKLWIRPEQARKLLDVTTTTLNTWCDKGVLECIRTSGGHRRYNLQSVLNRKNGTITSEPPLTQPITKTNYCYARVSTFSQKEDLDRQALLLREKFPDYTVVRDTGSGLNFNRKGFKAILDQAIKGAVGEIVVTEKDRLCRFGFELIEGLVQKYSHGRIVVLNHQETSPENELVSDLVSIITVFSSRVYGLRSGKVKRAIKEACHKTKTEAKIKEEKD